MGNSAGQSKKLISPEQAHQASLEKARARGLPEDWTLGIYTNTGRTKYISPDGSHWTDSIGRAIDFPQGRRVSSFENQTEPPNAEPNSMTGCLPSSQAMTQPNENDGIKIDVKDHVKDHTLNSRKRSRLMESTEIDLEHSDTSATTASPSPPTVPNEDENDTVEIDSSRIKKAKRELTHEEIHGFTAGLPTNHRTVRWHDEWGRKIGVNGDKVCDTIPRAAVGSKKLGLMDERETKELTPEWIGVAMEDAKAKGLPDGWTVFHHRKHNRKNWLSPDGQKRYSSLSKALNAARPKKEYATALAAAYERGLPRGWTIQLHPKRKRKIWISPDGTKICDCLSKALLYVSNNREATTQNDSTSNIRKPSPAEVDGPYREFPPEQIAAAMEEAKARGLPDGWTVKYHLCLKRKAWISPDQSVICDCLARALIASKRDEDVPIANDSPPPPRFKMQQLSESLPVQPQRNPSPAEVHGPYQEFPQEQIASLPVQPKSNPSPAEVDGPYRELPPGQIAAAMEEAKARGLPDGWTVKYHLCLKRKVWVSPDQSVICDCLARALIASKRDEDVPIANDSPPPTRFKMQQLSESISVQPHSNPSPAEVHGPYREFPPEQIAAAMEEAKARGLPDGWTVKYNLRLKRKVWISPDQSVICDCLARALIASKESKQKKQKVTPTIYPRGRRVLTEEEVACSMQEAASRGLPVDDGWHVAWNNHRRRKNWISPSGKSYKSLGRALEVLAVEERRQGLAINHYHDKDTSQVISDQPVSTTRSGRPVKLPISKTLKADQPTTTTRSGRPVKPPISKTLEAYPYPAAGQSHHERSPSAQREVSTDRGARLKSSNDREHLLSLALCEAKARGLPDGWSIYWDSGRKRRRWCYKSADGSVVRVCDTLPMALAYSEKHGLANSTSSNTEHSPPTSSDSTLGESGLPLGWRTVHDNESRRQIFLSPDGRYCHTLPQALAVALQMTSSRYHRMAPTEVSAILEVAKSKGLVDWTVAWDKDADSIKWVSPGGRLCNSMERALSVSSAQPCSLMDVSTDNKMEQTKEIAAGDGFWL